MWITTRRAGQMAGVSEKLIASLAKSKILNAKKKDGYWMIDSRDIKSYQNHGNGYMLSHYLISKKLDHNINRFPDKRIRCKKCMKTIYDIVQDRLPCEGYYAQLV